MEVPLEDVLRWITSYIVEGNALPANFRVLLTELGHGPLGNARNVILDYLNTLEDTLARAYVVRAYIQNELWRRANLEGLNANEQQRGDGEGDDEDNDSSGDEDGPLNVLPYDIPIPHNHDVLIIPDMDGEEITFRWSECTNVGQFHTYSTRYLWTLIVEGGVRPHYVNIDEDYYQMFNDWLLDSFIRFSQDVQADITRRYPRALGNQLLWRTGLNILFDNHVLTCWASIFLEWDWNELLIPYWFILESARKTVVLRDRNFWFDVIRRRDIYRANMLFGAAIPRIDHYFIPNDDAGHGVYDILAGGFDSLNSSDSSPPLDSEDDILGYFEVEHGSDISGGGNDDDDGVGMEMHEVWDNHGSPIRDFAEIDDVLFAGDSGSDFSFNDDDVDALEARFPEFFNGRGCREVLREPGVLYCRNNLLPRLYKPHCFILSCLILLMVDSVGYERLQKDFKSVLDVIKPSVLVSWLSKCGIDIGLGISSLSLKNICEHLRRMSINLEVFDIRRVRLFATAVPNPKFDVVSLLYHDKHYSPIIDKATFFAANCVLCHRCGKKVPRGHFCFNLCLKCGCAGMHHTRINGTCEMVCPICNVVFFDRVCYLRHLNNKLSPRKNFTYCEMYKRCTRCCRHYELGSKRTSGGMWVLVNEHVCSYECKRCGYVGSENTNVPVFNYRTYLDTLDDSNTSEIDCSNFHQCYFKCESGGLASFLIFYDCETYTEKARHGAALLVAHLVYFKIICRDCFAGSVPSSGKCTRKPCGVFSHYEGTDCFILLWKYLKKTKFDGKDVIMYAHNSSRFDAKFLMNAYHEMCPSAKANYVNRGNIVMKCSVRVGGKVFHIHDTCLIIPGSLDALAKSCSVATPKGWFPYEMIPYKLHTIYLPGSMPEKKEFACHNISILEDAAFNEWYEKQTVLGYNVHAKYHEYCRNDVQTLFEVAQVIYTTMESLCEGLQLFVRTGVFSASKLAMSVWSLLTYQVGNFKLYSFPKNLVLSRRFTSWERGVVVASLHVMGDLGYYSVKTGVFSSNASGDYYQVFDCLHFGCPKCCSTVDLRKVYARVGNGTLHTYLDEIICLLRQIHSPHEIKIVWDCEVRMLLRKGVFFGGTPLCDRKTLLDIYPDILAIYDEFRIDEIVYGGRVEAFTHSTIADTSNMVGYFDIVSLYPTMYMTMYGCGKYFCFDCGSCTCGLFHNVDGVPVNTTCYYHGYIRLVNGQTSRLLDDVYGWGGLKEDTLQEGETCIPPGFFYCQILPPRTLHKPYLHFRHNGSLYFPLCRYCVVENNKVEPCTHCVNERCLIGWYSSIEVYNAIHKYGYRLQSVYRYMYWENVFEFSGGFKKLYALKYLATKIPAEEVPEEYFGRLSSLTGLFLDHRKYKPNSTLRMFIKIIINSLWGRFSMRLTSRIYTRSLTVKEYSQMLVQTQLYSVVSVEKISKKYLMVSYRKHERECYLNFMPNIAAETTAKARTYLYYNINMLEGKLCGEECMARTQGRCTKHTICYCDTDSLIFSMSRSTTCDLLTGVQFGAFKDEIDGDKEIARAIFLGPKMYTYDVVEKNTYQYVESGVTNTGGYSNKTKIKGLHKHLQKELESKDLLSLLIPNTKLRVVNNKPVLRRAKNNFIYTKVMRKGDDERWRGDIKRVAMTCNKRWFRRTNYEYRGDALEESFGGLLKVISKIYITCESYPFGYNDGGVEEYA